MIIYYQMIIHYQMIIYYQIYYGTVDEVEFSRMKRFGQQKAAREVEEQRAALEAEIAEADRVIEEHIRFLKANDEEKLKKGISEKLKHVEMEMETGVGVDAGAKDDELTSSVKIFVQVCSHGLLVTENDESSGSEYEPDSSSAYRSSSSRHGRLQKEEKRNMSQQDLEDRRKEANKRNSKKYNKNKKEKEEKLMDDLAVQRNRVSETTKRNQEWDEKLIDSFRYIERKIEAPRHGFTDKESYEQRKSEIETDTEEKRINDKNLQRLAEKLKAMENIYNEATDDLETKTKNQNTFGSRKSRALHNMNIAKYEYDKASIQHDIERIAKLENLMIVVQIEVRIWCVEECPAANAPQCTLQHTVKKY
uniref:Uncharacterized protein n=2 Tax=Caenorhabditis japonica TaxID=281687 RepID=A0A8R1E2A2_CAEJA